ncbi:MAG: DUF502 domain-containing protein [Phycisphaerales bacterium]|jgi:uncharacterized membrane protein|nr:DUF502 domain-containing protein [Phycisphaerales bacterium]MBT7171286.1 DUF502 domain-containing protein [Phycisphaerales bacterium]
MLYAFLHNQIEQHKYYSDTKKGTPMQKFLKTFMTGIFVVLPLAATAWIVWWVGTKLGGLGVDLIASLGISVKDNILAPIAGGIMVLLLVYLVGLLTNLWLFNKLLSQVDKLLSRVPGIKTVYESVRDLLNLFGGDNQQGYAVLYHPPSLPYKQLGVVTNEHPDGIDEPGMVLVHLPMGYMIGGQIILVPIEHTTRLDMPVETAMKLAATAFVSNKPALEGDSATPSDTEESTPETE